MSIINQVVSGGGSPAPTTRYGLNDKAWAGDLITDSSGNVTMRTDQAVGTLTGLETVTGIRLNGKFYGSTGLVGAVNLGSVVYGGFNNAFAYTGITLLNLKKLRSADNGVDNCCDMCNGCSSLVSVDLSDLFDINTSQSSPDCGIARAFSDCTSLRELRLPAVRLDSWYWYYEEDPETGEETILHMSGVDDGLRGLIEGCSNLVVHLSSSLGEDLENLDGSDERNYLFKALCGYDSATMASCSVVYDLPPNDPFRYEVGAHSYTANRQPSSDTATALAWYINDNSIVYTSGLSAPQVGDTVYSDSDCTVAISTIEGLLPVYEYVEPEPEEGE